jgi:iron complex transport system substrate-binding protein
MTNKLVAFVTCLLTLSSAALHAEPLRVTDQRGKTLELAKPAERIVTIPIPAASILMTIDGGPRRLVGMHPVAMTAIRQQMLGRIFPAALDISTGVTRGGFVPNVEAILALSPDVVFQWANEGDEVIAALDRAGIPTLGMLYGTQQTLEGYMRMMGAVTGNSPRVDTIIERQRSRWSEIERAMADVPAASRPKVLYFPRFSGGNFAVHGSDNYQDLYIRLSGGINAAAGLRGHTQSVTFEQIVALDPEVILLGSFDAATPKDLYGDPRWQAVRAVRERKVYRMPIGGYRWDPPNQESALTWTWLARLLHPNHARFDLAADMRDWFGLLYGYNLTDAEIDEILNVAANGGSSGYRAAMGR